MFRGNSSYTIRRKRNDRLPVICALIQLDHLYNVQCTCNTEFWSISPLFYCKLSVTVKSKSEFPAKFLKVKTHYDNSKAFPEKYLNVGSTLVLLYKILRYLKLSLYHILKCKLLIKLIKRFFFTNIVFGGKGGGGYNEIH